MNQEGACRGRVLRFPGTEKPMREGVTGRLLDYWERLRDGRVVPPRAAIDPRRIEALLPYSLILERIEAGPARIRLAGAHPVALMGMELRGMPAEALIAPEARAAFAARIERVFAGPEIAEVDLRTPADTGPPLAARMIALPLSCDRGRVSRALCAFVAERVAGPPPRRFVPVAWRMRRLLASDTAAGAAPAFADAPAAFQPAPAPAPDRPGGRPHLRLVRPD